MVNLSQLMQYCSRNLIAVFFLLHGFLINIAYCADEGPIRILSIDGGGVRVAVSTQMLSYLEEQTGKPICESFHMIGGVSMGAVVATMLTTPDNPTAPFSEWKPKYQAKDLIRLFTQERGRLFCKRDSVFQILKQSTLYDTQSIEDVATSYYGDNPFDQAIIPTVVIATDSSNLFKPYIFRSWDKDHPVLVKDVVLSSSAAPVFFKSRTVNITSRSTGVSRSIKFIDGVVSCNSPAQTLLEEAKKLYPRGTRFEIVSLGSGHCDDIPPSDFRSWMRNPLLAAKQAAYKAFSKASQAAHEELKATYQDSYWRFSPSIAVDHIFLDDISEENIKYLLETGTLYIQENRTMIDRLIERLSAPKSSFKPREIS